MRRAVLIALSAPCLLLAGTAQAQQICCAPTQPSMGQPPTGMRGYAQPQYAPPAYPQQAQYAPPQYAPPQYAPPQYPPRPAPSGLRGYVGVEYGSAKLNPDDPSPKIETWTGEGAVAGQIGGFGVQGDLKVADRSGAGATSWSPTLHIYKRNPYGLIGGWVGYSGSEGDDLFGLGVEGQAYMNSATIYGSVGYGKVDGVVDQSLWAARLEGRYFVTEDLRLDLKGALVRGGPSGARQTVRSIGVGAEYQPGALPFSIQGSYIHADASNSSAESDTIRIGLRWNFDGGTLAERDRLGASLVNVADQFMTN